MKKTVILALIALFFGNIAFSQTDEFVLTWAIVENEAKKSDAEIANPKKVTKINTWTERGRKYLQVYTFDNVEKFYYGYSSVDIMTIWNGAQPKATRESGDTTIKSYDRMDFYFVGDKLVKYARTERAKEFFFPTHDAALDVAAEAYLKANELNVDGKKTKLINEQVKKISDFYQKEALFYINAGKYALAAPFYNKAGNLAKTGLTGDTDSVRVAVLNNCGEINKAAELYDQAIEFYNGANEILPSAKIYGNIYFCQLIKKDTANAVNTLQTVLEKFPNDSSANDYVNQLIEIYIKTNQTENAMVYLKKALETNPNNTAYLFNLGYLNETIGNEEEAISYYKRAVEVNPNEENANLNLGVLYENKAKVLLEKADQNYGKKNYQSLKNEGLSYLKLAYPYIATYAEVTTDSFRKLNAYKDLMSIYGKLSMMDKYNETKAKYDALKSNR